MRKITIDEALELDTGNKILVESNRLRMLIGEAELKTELLTEANERIKELEESNKALFDEKKKFLLLEKKYKLAIKELGTKLEFLSQLVNKKESEPILYELV